MAAVQTRAAPLRGRPACVALGVAPATYDRHQRPVLLGPWPRRRPRRALSGTERQTVLAAQGEGRERRAQRRGPHYAAPELLATGPNQLWSWNITKLKGPAKWTYYYFYVVLDVFSRYVVGWMAARRESAALAERLIATSCARQGITPGQLTLHADRGFSMTSKPVALLLSDLGVTKTHSQPSVSNDNSYSEAQCKTLKYRPDFPDRFGSLEHARAHSTDFFPWYNTAHRHSASTRRTTCTTASRRPGAPHGPRSSRPRTPRDRIASSATTPCPPRSPRRPGSIPPSSSSPQRTCVSKRSPPGVSNSLTGSEYRVANQDVPVLDKNNLEQRYEEQADNTAKKEQLTAYSSRLGTVQKNGKAGPEEEREVRVE